MNIKNVGKVKQIKDGVVYASGLSDVGYSEIVKINTKKGVDVLGIALNLEENQVGIVTLGDYQEISEGDNIEATGKLPSIEVDNKLLGRVINPLGKPLDGREIAKGQKIDMPMEKIAPGVIDRQNVSRPLQTGIIAIDSMIPIGRGQRELIIGDRQIGKTAIAIDTIINQKKSKSEIKLPQVYCIYVAIGQKASKVAQIKAKLELEGALDYTIIVAANASDSASLQYLAPYAGTAIGEYFAENGKDVLIIYDDLTKHAWAYREISLLLQRPPGREAYPGDIFYIHSKLLERSVQFSDKKGGGSLTALPIVETQAGDVSAYIPTNIISITDGQIYLESDLFSAGIRPAVSVGLSVSRVGGDAQLKPMKQVAGQLRLDLAQYRALEAFAQFGSDLDPETQAKLDRGKRMMELLKQVQYAPIPVAEQILMIYAGNQGYLDNIKVEDVKEWKEKFIQYLQKNEKIILDKLANNNKIEKDLEEEIKKLLEKFQNSSKAKSLFGTEQEENITDSQIEEGSKVNE